MNQKTLSWTLWMKIFFQMLRADMIIFRKEVLNKIINSCIYTIAFIIISAYILPVFGTSSSYGLLIAVSLIVDVGIFEVWSIINEFISDITGDRIINFYLTLPIPSWLTFLHMIVYSACSCIALALCVIPVSKILLWNEYSLAAISWWKFLLIFTLINLFYPVFSLLLTTTIKQKNQLANIWMRIVFPLFILGGSRFTWYSFYAAAPKLALINLLNPFVYCVEGIRVAILGQEGNLPFSLCFFALLAFIIVLYILMMKRVKQKLDYV